jgi:hypothetical protein
VAGDVRLGDVAQVTLGPEPGASVLRANGQTGIGLGIIRQANGNTLAISPRCGRWWPSCSRCCPKTCRCSSPRTAPISSTAPSTRSSWPWAERADRDGGDLRLPARCAGDADPGDRDAGGADRHGGGGLAGGVFGQHPDACWRWCWPPESWSTMPSWSGKHRAAAVRGDGRPGGGGLGHRTGVLCGAGDDDDAGRRLRAAVLPARPDRRAVPGIRLHAGDCGAAVFGHGADFVPGAGLALFAPASAGAGAGGAAGRRAGARSMPGRCGLPGGALGVGLAWPCCSPPPPWPAFRRCARS